MVIIQIIAAAAVGLLALELTAVPAAAQTFTGSDLYQACTSSDSSRQAFCTTFLLGVFDGIEVWEGSHGRPQVFCTGQKGHPALLLAFTQYARQSPGNLTWPAASVAAAAFLTAYPCRSAPTHR